MKFKSTWLAILTTVMLFSTFLTTSPVLALEKQSTSASSVPTLKTPHDTILDTTPVYKWQKVSGATQYQFQVFKGTTKLLDNVVSGGICGATYCQRNPSLTLKREVYKWRVRAKVDGSWTLYSPYMFFTISTPSFNNTFDYGSAEGWTRKSGGTWSVYALSYYTEGLPDKWTTAYYKPGQFTDFDYTAQFYRYGDDPTYLAVRMGSTVASANGAWYPGYLFGYTNDGLFMVRRYNASGAQTLTQISTTGAIAKNSWNTLRVRAVGNEFWFYINGTLVYNFVDTTAGKRSRGYIGIATYRSSSSSTNGLFVAYAKLDVIKTPQ